MRALLCLLPLVDSVEEGGPAWPVSHGQWGWSPGMASEAEGRAGCPWISPGTRMGSCWQGFLQMDRSMCQAHFLEVPGVPAAHRPPETFHVPSEANQSDLIFFFFFFSS